MNTNNNGTNRTRMDMSRLESTIDELHSFFGSDGSTPKELDKKVIGDAIYYLEFFFDKYENNKLYHAKQNAKKNLAMKLMKQQLSPDELRELDRQADIAIGNIHQEPTFED